MSAEAVDVKSVFGHAIEIQTPEERARYLDQACGDNEALRAEVEALIDALHKAGGFMQHPAADGPVTVAHSPAFTSGTLIAGRYKLLGEIAEGGMGTVWIADQVEPVRRRVAVKLIKPGMDSRQVLSRFEAERQALALMDHPNIAKVLDGGVTEQGRPFFVMEYVKGVPITDYCDQGRLNVRERLKLFVQVCQAVQHAHQKGIIHRDLKPSNILVCPYDGQPVPKVIDFGLAKAMHQPLTERTVFTAHGLMVGTPLYMSPEQAEFNNLDVDTRTDVYSLGVILYELLTGATPLDRARFKDAAWQEIIRLIKEEEPTKPSTKLSGSDSLPAIAAQRSLEPAQLSRVVRGDLDWIVMKSLEKERTRRYETANGLARDIERYLHDDPVEARPPSAIYRFRKFARRNRMALFTVSLVSTAMVVGTAASIWQAIRATRAEQVAEAARADEVAQRKIAEDQRNAAVAARAAEIEQRQVAEAERAEAEKQRTAADANFQKARATVEEYFTLVSESKLFDVPGTQSLRKELLEAAERFYRDSSARQSADPTILADTAVTNLRLGMIYLALNRIDDALAALRDGLNLVDRLRREHGDAAGHLRRLAGFWRGLRWTTDTLAAPRDPLGALATMLRLEKTWTELAVKCPAESAFRADLGAVRAIMGSMLTQYGRAADGELWFRKGLATFEELMREYPGVPQYRADLLAGAGGMTNTLLKNGKAEEARVLLRKAIEIGQGLLVEFPTHPIYRSDLADAHVGLANLLVDVQPPDALAHFAQAAELSESLVREFSGVPDYVATSRIAAHGWLTQADKLGDAREVEVASRALIRVETFLMAQDYTDIAPRVGLSIGMLRLARVLESDPARADRAEDFRRRGLAVLEEYADDIAAGDAAKLNSLAWGLVVSLPVDPALGEFAVQTAKRAVEAAPKMGAIMNTLGVAYYRNSQWAEAVDALLQARKLGGSHICVDGYFLAMAYEKQGQHETALRWFRAAQGWTLLYGEFGSLYREPAELLGFPAERPPQKAVTPQAEQKLLRLILEADPGEAHWVHGWLAEKAVGRGDWKAAVEAFANGVAQSPDDANVHYRHALVQLKLGDLAGYGDSCQAMREQFVATTDPTASHGFSWTCGLAPGALGDLKAPLTHAQRLIEEAPDHAEYFTCLGMLLYRAGRFDEAALRLAEADAALSKTAQETTTPIYPKLLLAMTHSRLGHAEEARQWLAGARAAIEKEPLSDMTWNRRATVELLLGEAEQLIPAD